MVLYGRSNNSIVLSRPLEYILLYVKLITFIRNDLKAIYFASIKDKINLPARISKINSLLERDILNIFWN